MDLSYNEAYSQLEKLVEEIEDNSIQLEDLTEKIKQAQKLVEYCEQKLRAIDNQTSNTIEENLRD